MRTTLALPALTLLIGLLLLVDPSLANRFETISGGVSGSVTLKRQFVQTTLWAGGGIFLLGALLAVMMRNSNAALLNYRNWKASSIVMLTLGALLLIFSFLV